MGSDYRTRDVSRCRGSVGTGVGFNVAIAIAIAARTTEWEKQEKGSYAEKVSHEATFAGKARRVNPMGALSSERVTGVSHSGKMCTALSGVPMTLRMRRKQTARSMQHFRGRRHDFYMNTSTSSVAEELSAKSTWLRRLARSLVGSDAADDAVQETMVAALRNPPSLDRPVRPWLATVLQNVVRLQ